MNRKRYWHLYWHLLSLFSIPLVSVSLLLPITAQAQQTVEPGSLATASRVGSVTPTRLAAPPQLTSERSAFLQAAIEQQARLRLSRPTGYYQAPVTEAPDGAIGTAPDIRSALPEMPGNPFVVHVSSALSPAIASTIGEPSLAQTGGAVFYTGNWYAAVAATANPGPADWTYIDPAADMPDFCCDQDVINDPARDLMLWTRLGINGRFLLGASNDHGTTFCQFELNPAQLGRGGTYDQPLMALSNNSVYISATIFGPFANVLLRISLDTLQDCPASISYTFWDITDANGWGSLVSGATTTMYFGSHRGINNTFRIYSQPESSNSIFRTDNTIPAFTFQNRNSNCPVSGTNPCARSDSRVQTGWVTKGSSQTVGEVGFMWDAREGGSFPWAYVEAATFRQDTLARVGRPFIAYTDTAVEYPYASPDRRGDLGLTTFLMGGSHQPDNLFYVADDYQGMWTFETFLGGSNGSANAWGDYVRNRAYQPCQGGWASAGYSLVDGSITPRLSVVSRQRDAPCVLRYLNAP